MPLIKGTSFFIFLLVSAKKTDVSTGARVWRLPPPSSTSDSEEDDAQLDFADQPTEPVEQLDFVSSLPFDDFSAVKR